MAHAYSLDLRLRVLGLVERGGSCRETARHFDVSPSFVAKLVGRMRRTGSAEPRARGGSRGKLAGYRDVLVACVEEHPDITMPELAARLDRRGLSVAPASLSRFLRRIGFRFKKNADGIRTRTRGCETQAAGLDRPPIPHAKAAGTADLSR